MGFILEWIVEKGIEGARHHALKAVSDGIGKTITAVSKKKNDVKQKTVVSASTPASVTKNDSSTPLAKDSKEGKGNPTSCNSIEDALAIVREDAFNLKRIPEEFRTYDVCLLAVQDKRPNLNHTLEDVPEHLKTPEICQVAVQNEGYALKFVPEHLKTPEICQVAVQNRGYALRYVPENLKTEELCRIAVQSASTALKYVPEHIKTKVT